MKKSLLIASTLAMVLGVGVAVGARQAKTERVEATDTSITAATTIYLDKTALDWYSPYINYRVGSNPESGWTFTAMKLVEGNLYSYEVPADTQVIQFNHTSTWHDNCYTAAMTPQAGGAGLYNKYTLTSQSDKIYGDWGYEQDTDPAVATNQFYVYDKSNSLGAFANLKVYGFGAAGNIKAMDWPGDHSYIANNVVLGKTTMYQVTLSQSYSKVIINNGTSQTADSDETIAQHVGGVLTIKSTKTDNKFDVEWENASKYTDYPAEDGYYLVGSKTNFKYNGATSIPALAEPDAHHNVAILRGYPATAGEKIKARSYFSSVDTWFDSGDGTIAGVGAPDEDFNFVFTTAGSYDIFVQKDGDNKAFYVAVHQEFVNIGVVNRFFTGKTMTSYENGASQDCVKGQKPTLIDPHVNGYVFRGWFTNPGCTEAFDKDTVLNDDITLQAKFTKVGYYTISEAGNWSIDNADPMTTEDIGENNNAETSVTVTAIGERYSFVEYDSSGVMHGQSGVGENDGIATYDNEKGNVVFSKTGTFAVYLSKDGKVYLNAGAAAFYTNFLNDVSAVCNTVGSEGYIANLQAEWAEQKIAYTNLTDEEKNAIKAVGFNGGSDADDLHRVIKKYNRIVTKYGSALFEDFIWGQVNIQPQTSVLYPSPIIETSNIPVIVIVAATITAISLGLFFILKKKETK